MAVLSEIVLRRADIGDAQAIARIFSQGIEDRIATFETEPRTAEDVRQWFEADQPIVVVQHGDAVAAYASLYTHSDRACYAGIGEFSVYVERNARGGGFGKIALKGLIDLAATQGYWKLISRIFPENTASLALCESVGFRVVGTYQKHGKLEGVWRDCVIVEYLINDDRS